MSERMNIFKKRGLPRTFAHDLHRYISVPLSSYVFGSSREQFDMLIDGQAMQYIKNKKRKSTPTKPLVLTVNKSLTSHTFKIHVAEH